MNETEAAIVEWFRSLSGVPADWPCMAVAGHLLVLVTIIDRLTGRIAELKTVVNEGPPAANTIFAKRYDLGGEG